MVEQIYRIYLRPFDDSFRLCRLCRMAGRTSASNTDYHFHYRQFAIRRAGCTTGRPEIDYIAQYCCDRGPSLPRQVSPLDTMVFVWKPRKESLNRRSIGIFDLGNNCNAWKYRDVFWNLCMSDEFCLFAAGNNRAKWSDEQTRRRTTLVLREKR